MFRTEEKINFLQYQDNVRLNTLVTIRRYIRVIPKFLRYALVGGFATAVHYVVLVTLVELFSLSPLLAASLGAACGVVIAYAGNRLFTFGNDACHRIVLPRFMLVAVLGTVLNGAIVWAGMEILSLHYMSAQVAATLWVLMMTYSLNRTWTFA